MDCSDPSPDHPKPFDYELRRVILGLSPERAAFLSSCAHQGFERDETTRHIPYSDEPLIREAARIGISLKDTATMMGMTNEQVAAYGFTFVPKTLKYNPPGVSVHNLFTEDHEQPHKIRRLRR